MISDFRHQVMAKVKAFSEYDDFPKMKDYGLDMELLDEYLFDKQLVMDQAGSPRKQYTVTGVLIVLPVIILSAIPIHLLPRGIFPFLLALAVGLILAGLERMSRKVRTRIKLNKIKDDRYDEYIEKVIKYQVKI